MWKHHIYALDKVLYERLRYDEYQLKEQAH
jgi:hypothetical protein